MAVHKPGAVLTTMFDGQLIVGASVSLTVTVKLHVTELLAASVNWKVFVVVPFGKAAPLASPAV